VGCSRLTSQPFDGSVVGETQFIGYTRRGYFENFAGPGFDPRRLHKEPSDNSARRKIGPAVTNCRACFLRHESPVFRASGIVVHQFRVTHPLADRAKKGLEVLKRPGTT